MTRSGLEIRLAVAGAAALLLASAGSAVAQDQTPVPACQSGGNNYTVGETACIPACHGTQQLAKCEMIDGKPVWQTVANTCPSAMYPTGRRFAGVLD